MPQDRSIIDTASWGVLVNKTPEVTCYLITNMAANSKNFSTLGDFHTKCMNEVNSSNLNAKIEIFILNKTELTSIVKSLMCGGNMATTYSIYIMNDHTIDLCPQMYDEPIVQANAIGNFNS